MNNFKLSSTAAKIIIGALLLQIIAFYNAYPLVYSDTGTYIYSGFDLFVPKDRPVLYGLFIRIFSLKQSLWLVIFAQNFITAFLVYKVLQLFIKTKLTGIYYLCISFLMIGTSIGWYTNQIMPDFFAPVLILTWIWILFEEKMSWRTLSVSFILIVLANCSHFSHLLMSSFLLFLILLSKTIIGRKTFLKHISINKKKLLTSALVVVMSWVMLPTINALVSGNFQISKGSHVFLVAHLNEKGLLKKILDNYCGSDELGLCSLCDDKDSLPQDIDQFIWSGGFLEKHGGWENSKEDFQKVINLSLKNPKYLTYNLLYSGLYGVTQLTNIETGEGLSAYIKNSMPYSQVTWWFPHEKNAYLNAKQNKHDGINLKFSLLNVLHVSLIIISIAFLIYILMYQTMLPKNHKALIYFTFLCVFCNSMVTAGLSAPYSRYQSRVIWLIPFIAFIMLLWYIKTKKSKSEMATNKEK